MFNLVSSFTPNAAYIAKFKDHQIICIVSSIGGAFPL